MRDRTTLVRRVVDLRAGEGRTVALAFAACFCVLASYYVLRPLREAMGIVGNVKDLSTLFLGTLAGTLALTPALAALVSRYPRQRFLPIVYRFFALNLVVFYLLLRGAAVHPNVARVFFVWTSVFNMFALSVFWGLMSDLFRREQGLRLFGVIGAGGTLGAMFGSLVTAVLVERFGIAVLVLLSAVLLELGVRFIGALVRGAGEPERTADDDLAAGGVLAWLRRIPKSPYLLAIIAYMLLFTFTSTSLYFEQARIVKAHVASNAARTALFAKMDLAVNMLSVGLQALVVGPLLRRLGVGITLAILPLLTVVGFVVLGAVPTVGALVFVQVVRRAADYGIAKPSREVLFTVVPRADKYKAKSFIDTFVYRAGDAIGALAEGGAARSLVVAVPLCLAWTAIAYVLGRRSAKPNAELSQLRSST